MMKSLCIVCTLKLTSGCVQMFMVDQAEVGGASHGSLLLMWLPKESHHNCRDGRKGGKSPADWKVSSSIFQLRQHGTHNVWGGNSKVDRNGGQCDQRPGILGFMDPAADRLQLAGALLKLLPQSQQQEYQVNTAAGQKLSRHWTNPVLNNDKKELMNTCDSIRKKTEWEWSGISMDGQMYRGAGINTWTAISSNERMKEQTMLDLKCSSLIWEYWETKRGQIKPLTAYQGEPAHHRKWPHYLSLHIRVLEHLSEGCDVLLPHSLAASNLDGLTDPLLDFTWSRLLCCNVIGQLG